MGDGTGGEASTENKERVFDEQGGVAGVPWTLITSRMMTVGKRVFCTCDKKKIKKDDVRNLNWGKSKGDEEQMR